MTRKITKKLGRPSKYKKEYCDLAIARGKEGKMPLHIANEIMVTRSTIQEWEARYPDFLVAMTLSRQFSEAFISDTLDNAASQVDVGKAKWKLSAYYRVAEVQKIEAKQEITGNIKTDLIVSFDDVMEDDQD